jgi:enoyl-CoA hydratase/carnithine racemase
MEMGPSVRLEFDERGDHARVATIRVEHPEKLNVLNTPLIRQFIQCITRLKDDENLRAVILTGAGDRAFIGGADVRELARLDPRTAKTFISNLHAVCAGLRAIPVPVVARIQGYCLGGGLEIAAACDLRVASEDARFGMPEVKVGIPSVIEAALLPSLIGWGRTRELVYLGDIIDAQTAAAWGLVERLAPPDRLDAEVEKVVAGLLAVGPRALRLQKALVQRWENLPVDEAIEEGIGYFSRAYRTNEPATFMDRFLNRPKPGDRP